MLRNLRLKLKKKNNVRNIVFQNVEKRKKTNDPKRKQFLNKSRRFIHKLLTKTAKVYSPKIS